MTTSYVTGAATPVVTQSTQLARIDADGITRAAMESNSQALAAYLRTVAPALPTWRNDQAIDAPAPAVNDLGRTTRLRIVIIAIVVICAIVSLGLGLLAYRVGADGMLATALFFTLWGGSAFYAVSIAQRTDTENAPEVVAAHGARYSVETDADSRARLAAAYAHAIEVDATAKADVHRQSAQTRQAEIDRDVLRLQTATRPAPPPPVDTCGDLPAAVPQTCIPPADTCAPPAMSVSVAAVVLSWLEAGIKSGDIQPGRYIRKTAPWSDRGELPESVRGEVRRRLATCQPPMIEAGTGGLYRFGPYGWVAARATVRGILSDL